MKRLLLLLVCLVLVVYPAMGVCADLSTVAASDITSKQATLNANVAVPQNIWFEFGTTTGVYTLRTANITGTVGAVSKTIKGGYYQPGIQYFFRAACQNCSGDELNFISTTETPVPTQTFGAYATNFTKAKWNLSALLPIMASPFEGAMSGLGAPPVVFYGVAWLFLFAGLWIRQENMLIPVMLFAILAPVVVFSGFLPGAWIYVAYLVVILVTAGVFYILWRGR